MTGGRVKEKRKQKKHGMEIVRYRDIYILIINRSAGVYFSISSSSSSIILLLILPNQDSSTWKVLLWSCNHSASLHVGPYPQKVLERKCPSRPLPFLHFIFYISFIYLFIVGKY
jgi:hypothetical protein